MKDFVCKILKIKRSELHKTFLVALFSFLVIFAYYLIKPSKEALFVQYMGSAAMSDAYIAITIATLLFLFFYDYLVRRFRRSTFGSLLMVIFIVNLLIFWLMFKLGIRKPAAYALYIWSDIFSAATVTYFWSFTNDIYDSETAKKVYGFLGICSQVGAICGSRISEIVAKNSETEILLLLSGIAVIFIITVILRIDSLVTSEAKAARPEVRVSEEIVARFERKSDVTEVKETAPGKKASAPAGKGLRELYRNFLMVIRSRHLRYFTFLLCMMLLCSNLMHFQINRILEATIPDKDGKTVFFAQQSERSNSLCLILLLLAPYFYRIFGIFGTLYTLPSINLFTISLFFLSPALSIVAAAKVLDEGLKYGVIQVTREMLYIPCTKEEKYRAKAVIDILFYRVVKVLSAGLMYVFSTVIALSIRDFNIIIIVVLVINILVLHKLKEAFLERIEKKIRDIYEDNRELFQAASRDRVPGDIEEGAFLGRLLDIIRTKGKERINAVELLRDDIPTLADMAGENRGNETVRDAILMIGRFYEDDSLYSLGLQYLNIVLPAADKKKYLPFLSKDACQGDFDRLEKHLGL